MEVTGALAFGTIGFLLPGLTHAVLLQARGVDLVPPRLPLLIPNSKRYGVSYKAPSWQILANFSPPKLLDLPRRAAAKEVLDVVLMALGVVAVALTVA